MTDETTSHDTPADEAPQATAEAHATANGGSDERVAKLEAEVGSLKDQLLRALAEAENIRRRAEREREDTAKYAVSKFAKELLAVADNLRRAVEAVPAETREADQAVNNLLTGVEATERQLLAAFDRGGIQKMEALDKPADPNFHQIMAEIEGTGKAPGTVVQVYQPGYTIHGRLLREAMVVVAKGGEAPKVDTSA
ncbi:nucleotide exchange factor GrpE [Aerophototrophica crusticola]|uniref:Protein GrpE n=1 Tax=Aerophototrophica crusticola TaxID=1709002 RepID=A0A858RB01_9PROT|nr:nucleotide exchange factor GrpE [Rhodospirillaceae bacterium B3]